MDFFELLDAFYSFKLKRLRTRLLAATREQQLLDVSSEADLINFIMFAESMLDVQTNKERVPSLLKKLEAVNENLAAWLRDRESQGYFIFDYWKPDHLDELYRLLEQVRQLN